MSESQAKPRSDAPNRPIGEGQASRPGPERWRSAVEAAGFGTYEADHIRNTFDASPQLSTILGIAPGVNLTPESLPASTHPDDLPLVYEAATRSLDPNGKGKFDIEHRVIQKDGTVRWVMARGHTEFDTDPATGKLRPVVSRGVVVDITERKEAEVKIKENEERLTMALQASRMAVWESDRQTNSFFFTQDNDRNVVGEQRSTIDHVWSRIHADDVPGFRVAVQRAIELGGDFCHQLRIRRVDSEITDWCEIRGRVHLRPGMAPRLCGVAVDISDSKRSIELLKRNEERLRLGTGIAGVTISEVDYLTNEVHLSPESAALFGYEPREMVVPREQIRELYHPEDREAMLRALNETLDPAGSGELSLEVRIIRLDGQLRWLAIRQRVFFEKTPDGEMRPTRGLYAVRDITEQKERESAYQAAQDRLALAVSSARMVVWEWGVASGSMAASDNCADVLGFTLNPNDLGLEHIHHDDRARMSEAVTAAIETGRDFRIEARLIRPDNGKEIWLEVRGRSHADVGSRPRLFGVSVDISASKQAQEQIRRNEERLRIGTEVAGVAIGEIDYRTDLVHLPGEAALILGLPPESVTITRGALVELWHADDREHFLTQKSSSVDPAGDGQCALEIRLNRPESDARWVAVRYQVFFASDSEGARTPLRGLFAVRDITERKKAEYELILTTERLKTAVKTARLAVFNQDLDLRYTWIDNPPLGLPPERFIGKTDYEVYPDRALTDQRAELKRRVMESGVGIRTEVCHTIEGSEYHFEMFIEPSRNAAGKVIGITGAALDITERKAVERKLQEADRHKDEFLAMLAHELRNPLAGVSNALQVLRMPEAEPADIEWAYEAANRQMRNLTRLSDDLLDVARIAHGKIRLKPERADFVAIAQRALSNVRPVIASRLQKLVVDLETTPLMVDADPTRMEQVLINILTNATKYSNLQGEILVSMGVEGSRAVFRVKDSGIGIAPEKIGGIFDLFTQIDTSLDRTPGGLGVGLAVAQRLAIMHGGRVEASSDGLGKGSVFSVWLPIPQDTIDQKPTQPASSQIPKRPLQILVVEDSPDILLGMKLLLTRAGHAVVPASEATSALEAARKLPFDVAILDIGLPGMDGYELARELRATAVTPNMLLIACSGYGREEDRASSLLAGFDHHLVKPVDYKSLTALLSMLQTR